VPAETKKWLPAAAPFWPAGVKYTESLSLLKLLIPKYWADGTDQ
jgi:hypothetical protein